MSCIPCPYTTVYHVSLDMISAPTVSTVVGSMKRWVSKELGVSVWQKSFYDCVIRGEKEYFEIWQYIDENPLKWISDELYIV